MSDSNDEMGKAIRNVRIEERLVDAGGQSNRPTLEELKKFEIVLATFIENTTEDSTNEESLQTIWENRHFFNYYNQQKAEVVLSSDFIPALFTIGPSFVGRYKIIDVIESMIYRDSPFLDQLIANGLYNLIISSLTDQKNPRISSSFNCVAKLADVSKEVFEPLMNYTNEAKEEFSLVRVIYNNLYSPALYNPCDVARFSSAVLALCKSTNYTTEHIKQNFRLLWSFLSKSYRKDLSCVYSYALTLLVRYVSSCYSVVHCNISQEKLEILFELLEDQNQRNNVLHLFRELMANENVAINFFQIGFINQLFSTSYASDPAFSEKCFVILSNMMSHESLIEHIIENGEIPELIKKAILDGSHKEGTSASLCIAKILIYEDLDYIVRFVTDEMLDLMMNFIFEDDTKFLVCFMQGLQFVLEKEVAANMPRFITAILQEENYSAILAQCDSQDNDMAEIAGQIIAFLESYKE